MNTTQIDSLRRARGWTQERLAEESGVAVRTIQRLEAGSDASLESLSRIADALQVDVKDLFVTVEDAGMATAVEGLDERRLARQRRQAAIASRQRVWTTIGWACVAIGALTAVGGTTLEDWPTYLIGGLVAVSAGLQMVPRVPRRLPVGFAWVAAAVTIAWMATLGWSWWLLGSGAVAIIACASVFTWLSTRDRETSEPTRPE